MSIQLYSIVEVAALVVGIAGPLWALLREVWRSEFLVSIWERRSIFEAVIRELLLLICFGTIVFGNSIILDLVLKTALLPSRIYGVLQYASDVLGVALLALFVGRAAHQARRHFRSQRREG